MAACYGEGLSGGVILGADTRTSSGNYIANRATDKITQLTDKVWSNLRCKHDCWLMLLFKMLQISNAQNLHGIVRGLQALSVYSAQIYFFLTVRKMLNVTNDVHATDIHVPFRVCS